jgi:hypothetical protein
MNIELPLHWKEIKKRYTEEIVKDRNDGGILNINSHNELDEINRVFIISNKVPILTALGCVDYAKEYSKVGLQLLRKAIEKKQKKILITTNVPSTHFEFHYFTIEYQLKSVLEENEDEILLKKIFELLSMSNPNNEKDNKIWNKLKPILLFTAVQLQKFDFAAKVLEDISSELKIQKLRDDEIPTNDWALVSKSIGFLTETNKIKVEVIKLFDDFFAKLEEPGRTGYHRPLNKRRPITVRFLPAYIYYKYLQSDIKFNPIIVWQSTIFGKIQEVIIENCND